MVGPKIKYSKERIKDQAILFIDQYGIEALSARRLAKFLGSSTQPLFRIYENFDALVTDVLQTIDEKHNEFLLQGTIEQSNFLNMGLNYVKYAVQHPNLFHALFMDRGNTRNSILAFFEQEESESILIFLSEATGLVEEDAKLLFRDLFITAHGIACLLATKQVEYSEEECKEILIATYNGKLHCLMNKSK